MVSVSKAMSAGQAGSYFSKDDYYTKEQGQWFGKGAEALGLEGTIFKDDFVSVAAGIDPETGKELVKAGGTAQEHRAGNDMTFSAPKSVTLLSLSDERVLEAHNNAVQSALTIWEKEFAQIRQTVDGITEKVDTGNIVAGIFNHGTSRELDPQLHSHVFVMNLSQNENQQWRAMSNENLFNQKMFTGTVYHSELAKNLNELGYKTEISDTKTGNFEVVGVEKELINEFSKRSEQIKHAYEEHKNDERFQGKSEAEIKSSLALETRQSKPKEIDREYLKNEWTDRFREHNTSPDLVAHKALIAGTEQTQEKEYTAKEYVEIAAKSLSEMESAVTGKELLSGALRLSVGKFNTTEIKEAISELKENGNIITLQDGKDLKQMLTTPEMMQTEKTILDNINDKVHAFQPLFTKEQAVEKAAKHETLSDNQRQFVEKVLTSESQFMIVQGYSGAGKTFAAAKVTDEAKELGYTIRALGPTAAAARELGDSTGVKGSTLSRFFRQSDEKLDFQQGKEIWLVDEASMIQSRDMLKLVNRAVENDARVILIGDKNQLQSVGAGKIFSDLQEHGVSEKLELTDIKRQKTEHMIKAAGIIRDIGNVKEAVDIIDNRGGIKEVTDFNQRVSDITNDYTSRDPDKTMLVVSTNAERHALNASIHDKLHSEGKLGQDEFTITIKENVSVDTIAKNYAQSYEKGDLLVFSKDIGDFKAGEELKITDIDSKNNMVIVGEGDNAKGIRLMGNTEDLSVYRERDIKVSVDDKMVFLKNDLNTVGVVNGDAGKITHLDQNGWMKIETAGGEKSFNLAQYNHLDLGHAITSYKAQGASIDHVIVSADPQHENYNDYYVAMTRGKEDATIYTADKEALKEAVSDYQQKTSTLDYQQNIETGMENDGTTKSGISEADKEYVQSELERSGIDKENVSLSSENQSLIDKVIEGYNDYKDVQDLASPLINIDLTDTESMIKAIEALDKLEEMKEMDNEQEHQPEMPDNEIPDIPETEIELDELELPGIEPESPEELEQEREELEMQEELEVNEGLEVDMF